MPDNDETMVSMEDLIEGRVQLDDDGKDGKPEFPFGTKYKYFETNGIPIRMLDFNRIPEIYRPKTKTWEPWPYLARIVTGDGVDRVSEEEFHRLVANCE